MVTLEEYKAYTVQNDFRLGASKHDDDDQYDLIEELSSDLDKINNNFYKKLKKIEVGLALIENIMDESIHTHDFNDLLKLSQIFKGCGARDKTKG